MHVAAVLLALSAALVLAAAALASSTDRTVPLTACSAALQTGLEHGSAGPPSVALQRAERLDQILLVPEYFAVKAALSSFILHRICRYAVSATVTSGSTFVHNNGSITFSVTVARLGQRFGVVLDRPSSSKMIFNVPSYRYRAVLYPFGH